MARARAIDMVRISVKLELRLWLGLLLVMVRARASVMVRVWGKFSFFRFSSVFKHFSTQYPTLNQGTPCYQTFSTELEFF